MLANMNGEVNGTTDETREGSPIKENDSEHSTLKEITDVEGKSNHSDDNHLDSESEPSTLKEITDVEGKSNHSDDNHLDSDSEPSTLKEITDMEGKSNHSDDNHLDSESVHSDDEAKKCSNNGELKNGLKNVESENSEDEPDENPSSNVNQSTIPTTEPDKTGDQNTEEQSKVNGKDKSDDKEEIINETDPIEVGDTEEDSIVSCDNEKTNVIDSDPEESETIEGSDEEPHIEDTVSINSDSGDSTQGGIDKTNDVIILENDLSPNDSEVHEIESDKSDNDCVVTEEIKVTSNKTPKKQIVTEPRRSSRTPKRVKYDEDFDNETESDVELVSEDTLKRKFRPIGIKNTKKLFEITSKQGKNVQKDTTVVIIDSPDKSLTASANFYQGLVGRGTTVTAVSCKSSTTTTPAPTQASQTAAAPATVTAPQPAHTNILPSLTDDMFVVEAPSFIVPYVYEKPSMKPFREFVDKLGKELEEEKAKEEKEKLEKKKEEKAKREKEKQEKRERGEEAHSSDEEKNPSSQDSQEAQDLKKKKEEKKERRRRKRDDDDDVSWDGSESDDTDDETISDEEANVIVLKDKIESIEEIKDIVADPIATEAAIKSDNYFDCSLGKFFTDIGINLVKEYVQTDLIKQQNRKLVREKKTGQNTRERLVTIAALMKNLELSKENNVPYKFTLKKCEFCSFKTESELAMANHLQIPHMKNNLYKCNFCPFQIKSPHDIIFHMDAEHNVKGKLERAPSYHECANCPFEDNGKGKLARHIIACAKKFKPDLNLSPPLEWEPPAKIPKLGKAKHGIVGPYSSSFGRASLVRPQVNPVSNVGMSMASGYRPRARTPQIPPRGLPIANAQIARAGLATALNLAAKGKSVQQPSISITPLPRQPAPIPIHNLSTQNSKGTFVICEICDGYIKDLEQLRNHMQWIHKVKIHPKMIYNRPPLNCQKCQFRFFTDQGLERHLLGSHGLVTSSMQEAANKGKDAGRCPVCGRVYQAKLLNHVSRDHSLTLKPAHLSYKCTVCTATFGMYKQFENHVYSAHSVVAKRVIDKNKPTVPPTKTADAKSLKINDEITITPQPATAPKSK